MHTAAVDSALVKLDIDGMAAKSNMLTGGCLRGHDAMKVARMVSFAALRAPEKIVSVAGIQGQLKGGTLYLAYSADIVAIEIPTTADL